MRATALALTLVAATSGCYLAHERSTADAGVDAAPRRDVGSNAIDVDGDAFMPPPMCPPPPSDVDVMCDVFLQDCRSTQFCDVSWGLNGGWRTICTRRPTAFDDCDHRCTGSERCIGTECLPICCREDPSCAATGGTCSFIDAAGSGVCIHPTPCSLFPNDCPDGRSCAFAENGQTYCRTVRYTDDAVPIPGGHDGYCEQRYLAPWRLYVPCPVGAQCLRVAPDIPAPLCAVFCRPDHVDEDCGGPGYDCDVPATPTLPDMHTPVTLPEGVGVCIPTDWPREP